MENVKIFAKTIEDEALTQIKKMADIYSEEKIRIMPDVHAGKGCTIGTTIKLIDKVTPNMVGVDIGCGMLCIELGKIDIDLKKLDYVINTYIPSGMNVHENPVGCESIYIIVEEMNAFSSIDYKRAWCSLGTLGGGNHFIEVDEDSNGVKYLVIHCGSRHLGIEVCKYWQTIATNKCNKEINKDLLAKAINKLKAEHKEKDIPDAIKALKTNKISPELAYLTGDDFESYIHDMRITQKFASENRYCIWNIIRELMGWLSLDVCIFETIHNYIDTKNGILRKGSVSANKGEKLLIPMNMRDGSLICIGKGNDDWNCSAPHGSGRLMSRTKAKNTLSFNEFEKSMEGIYTTSVCESTIDEAPMVYKDTEEIKELIKDTVDIVNIIKPIYNFKAKE